MEWFRWHHGTASDAKLSMIAKLVGARRCEMTAVWDCLMDHASQNEMRGRVDDCDLDVVAFSQDIPIERVIALYAALEAKSVIKGGLLTAWDRRQPRKEDSTAAARKQAQRDREKQARDEAGQDDDHTASRRVTLGHDRTEEIRTEQTPTPPPPSKPTKPRAERAAGPDDPADFQRFWDAYPRKSGKGAARKAFEKAKRKTAYARIMDSLATATGQWRNRSTDPSYIPHPATWLNQERWDDQPDELPLPRPALNPVHTL